MQLSILWSPTGYVLHLVVPTNMTFLADHAHQGIVPGAGCEQSNNNAEMVEQENPAITATNTDPKVVTAGVRDAMDSDLDLHTTVESSSRVIHCAGVGVEQASCSEGAGIQTPVDAVVLSDDDGYRVETTDAFEVKAGEVTSPMGMGKMLFFVGANVALWCAGMCM